MAEELTIKYTQKAITPFWKKLPFFFLFPFRFSPLVFMACIVAASAVAGLALGTFGLIGKGFLVYLGLRYAFNVLELFAKGRFEGHSVDHTLWGPEKRPAKLGLVIALFILIAITLGNALLVSRVVTNKGVQDQLVERYNKEHAEEVAQRARDLADFQKRAAAVPLTRPVPAGDARSSSDDEESDASERAAQSGQTAPSADYDEAPPDPGPTRAEMIAQQIPDFSDPLWFRLQPAWYWLVMLLLSLMLPSAAIVIALEDRFFKALNPLFVLHFIQTMGSAYFALWAFFLSIAGARQLALTAGARWPAALRFPFEMGLATYLALVLFAMMGYALYQFHQELHLDVDVDFDDHREAGGAEAIARAGSARAAMREVAPLAPWEIKTKALLAEGKVKEAIAEVRDQMRYDRYDPALNTRLHPMYVQQGDTAATLAHGQQWLTALARAGQGREAVAALRALQAIDPAFSVEDGDAILPTAAAAMQQGEHTLAANLLRGFDKRFPKHKDTPGVFFLGAKLLSEQMRQHDKAVKILRSVLAHFPDHAIAEEVKTYLAVLERVMGKAVAG